jgi:hypothetical protein
MSAKSIRLTSVAALAAMAALFAVPAVAQSSVPPIKRFPKDFKNGVMIGRMKVPTITFTGNFSFGGPITLENETFHSLECLTRLAGFEWNETTEGTEKGLSSTTGFITYQCKAEIPCKVTNTKGEEVEGIFVTAEAPPVAEGTEAHDTGITSLPWTGEFIERETGVTQLLSHHVKWWVVFPPPSVGLGVGCMGTELAFEEREGATEKEEGDELAQLAQNGAKNGTKPSKFVFEGQAGKTEKGFPQTGRLIGEHGGAPLYLKAAQLVIGAAEGFFGLMTWE